MKDSRLKKFLKKVKLPTWILVGFGVLLLIFIFISLIDNDFYIKTIKFFKLGETSWDWFAILIAFVSLFYAIITYRSQSQTEKNTMKITEESQREILNDYIRHFYCNLIIVCAIEAKLDRRYNDYYPSEEHLLKLKVDLGDLHPAAFYNHSEKYGHLHELLVKMRNYNTEIDVAILHLCNQEVFDEAKQRDFNTLKYKMSFLPNEINHTINLLWPNKTKESHNLIKTKIEETAQNRNKLSPEDIAVLKPHKYYSNSNNYFTNELFSEDSEKQRFMNILNFNIHTEITKVNSEGSPKILLIPFNKENRYEI